MLYGQCFNAPAWRSHTAQTYATFLDLWCAGTIACVLACGILGAHIGTPLRLRNW